MDTKQRNKSASAGRQTQKRTASGQNDAERTRSGSASSRSSTAATQRERQSRTARQRRSAASSRQRVSSQSRQRTAVRNRRERPVEKQEVVYTPAKPFNRNRLLLQLLTVAAVVVALVLGLSIFFKVKYVTVSGAEKYDAWTIREASGIKEGENLLTFGQAKASGKITTSLPYVKDVQIGIKLPDTVHIEITELDVVYAIQAGDNSWWLITAGGKVVEQVDDATAGENTAIIGVKLLSPEVQGQAAAMDAAQAEKPAESVSESQPTEAAVPNVSVTGAEQLAVALKIVQALEENGVFGKIATVNVTDLGALELWYGDRYQIELGDSENLDVKIQWMAKTVSQLAAHDSGIIDVSFTIWEDQAGYTPFT